MGAGRHLTWCWGSGETGTEPHLSRAHGEVFMGWSGELALLRVGMSGGRAASLLGHGREASSQGKRCPSFSQ